MKSMKIAVVGCSAMMLASFGTAAQAENFPYNNLPVDMTCLDTGDDDDGGSIILEYCPGKIKVADIAACRDAGGQFGVIGTRPVCANPSRPLITRPGWPPPFFPDAAKAKSFVPITIPTELYNGQSDPRAMK